MVTVTVDDQTFAFWKLQAERAGLTVEEWLKSKTLDSAAPVGSLPAFAEERNDSTVRDNVSLDSWKKHLAEFVASHPPTGRWVDDSRESIYD